MIGKCFVSGPHSAFGDFHKQSQYWLNKSFLQRYWNMNMSKSSYFSTVYCHIGHIQENEKKTCDTYKTYLVEEFFLRISLQGDFELIVEHLISVSLKIIEKKRDIESVVHQNINHWRFLRLLPFVFKKLSLSFNSPIVKV